MKKKLVESILTEHESSIKKIEKEVLLTFSDEIVLRSLRLIFSIESSQKYHKDIEDLDHIIKISIRKENLDILLEVIGRVLEKRGFNTEIEGNEIIIKGLKKN